MDEARLRYVEDFGLFLFERFGLSRMVGRVLGVLLVSDPPERTAEELAGLLRASRGSISQATRALVQMGMVRRLARPGERRDYFGLEPGFWWESTRRQTAEIGATLKLVERGLDLVRSDDPGAGRGLEEMRDFLAYWESELVDVLRRWDEGSVGRDEKGA